MNLLLIFALPIATIILAFVLEKIIRVPILTALTFFAIYLILAFTAFDTSFLVYAIIYTLLAYITALIAEYIYTNCTFKGINCNRCCNNNNNQNNSTNNQTANLSDRDIQRIAQCTASILRNTNCRR